MEKTSQEILKLIADDSIEEGFRRLVTEYQEPLYWQIRRMVTFHDDANDVLQNTFIKVYKNILKFNGESKLSTWMYRIAINESINYLKKMKKRRVDGIDDESDFVEKLKQDQYFDHSDTLVALQKAIRVLPEKQKAVFTMRYYEDLTYKEMADVLGGSIGSLKASYHHAVKKVEEYLKLHISHVA